MLLIYWSTVSRLVVVESPQNLPMVSLQASIAAAETAATATERIRTVCPTLDLFHQFVETAAGASSNTRLSSHRTSRLNLCWSISVVCLNWFLSLSLSYSFTADTKKFGRLPLLHLDCNKEPQNLLQHETWEGCFDFFLFLHLRRNAANASDPNRVKTDKLF